MARTKENGKIGSRSARVGLTIRREPYWFVLEKGRALGYRKGAHGGTWIARYYNPAGVPPRIYEALGVADDTSDPDGKMVLSFSQAQAAARKWFEHAYHQATGERVTTGPYTVADAVADYLEDRKRNGAKTADRMAYDFNARVLPSIGTIPVALLTRKRLALWLDEVAAAPIRRRGKEQAAPKTPEELRARKASANRLWKNLKAALNLAYREQKVATDEAWGKVKEFPGTKVARTRFLSQAEQIALVEACPAQDFRRLVQAGIFTGAREGELTRLVAKDFDPLGETIYIEFSKTGRSRRVGLTEEALAFFKEVTEGLEPNQMIFPREAYDRKQKSPTGSWSRAEISRMMADACRTAKIEPLVFHELRHTYASTMLNQGVPLIYVAHQLGHRDTTMVQEHYGHLCSESMTRSFRSVGPVFGIHKPVAKPPSTASQEAPS